ncbi:MAG: polymer-forming cytoskeletal protein [Acidiferrobacterales bacterium]|nr:polymer-forming cytoskeletal protein [Acidiferrobacterales bacterium]
MAIFDKSDKQTDYASNVTTIAAGTNIVGKIDIECNLHIDGEFEGEVNSKSIVKIGKAGLLKSNLKAQKLIVTGRFIGTADCDQIELVSGGEAEGKLISSGLVIDSNSSFQGESLRRSKGDSPKVLDFSSETSAANSSGVSKEPIMEDKKAKGNKP